jgi:hypothetical protein
LERKRILMKSCATKLDQNRAFDVHEAAVILTSAA